MKENYKSSERGQVLVLIALGMVALLGFTALAIDGSMMYSDRRFGQNSADASSLAGGGEMGSNLELDGITTKSFSCADGSTTITDVNTALADAVMRAEDNGFVIENAGSSDDIEDEPDAISEGSQGYVFAHCVNAGAEKHVDVIVELEVETKTSFVHFVYSGEVVQSVRSVTRVRPRKLLAMGNAVVALNPADCSGQNNGTGLHGSFEVGIYGGGVWSNGCLRVDGQVNDVHIPDGCVSYFSCPNPASCLNISQLDTSCFDDDPNKDRLTEDDYALDVVPDCNSGAADVYNYTINGQQDAKNKLLDRVLPPGLHCISGDVKMTSDTELIGYRVTMYFIDGSSLAAEAGAHINLTAVPFDEEDYEGSAIPGVVVYNDYPVPPDSNKACLLDFAGHETNRIEGVIWAPGCDISVTGNASGDYHHSQIIGWNVEVGGNAGTQVYFDESKAVSKPTYIDLWR